jgi:non-ribosomal peptide synthetase component F
MDSKLNAGEWLNENKVPWPDAGEACVVPAQAQRRPCKRPAPQPSPFDCAKRSFEISAQLNPGAAAIRHEQGTLTYGELDNQADGLAALLQQNGVESGTACAIFMDSSLALIRAMLAVLKAGGIYFLLNPALPREHMARLLHSFHPKIILVGDSVRQALPPSQAHVLSCNEDGADLPYAWPHEYAIDGQAPAYASGMPATMAAQLTFISHASVMQRLTTMQEQCPISDGDSVLFHPDHAFTSIADEFLWPLSNGAQLLMPSPYQGDVPAIIRDLIRQEHITVIRTNPILVDLLFAGSRRKKCTARTQEQAPEQAE